PPPLCRVPRPCPEGVPGEGHPHPGGNRELRPGHMRPGLDRQLEYNNDASRITDLARLSIEYETLEQLYEALKVSPESFEIVRIKDRFIKPTPGGYRDILLNIKLSNQHIAEVQLTLQSINEVRFGEGFKLYQQVRQILNLAQLENRDLTTTELQKIDQLNNQSQKLYDAALFAQPANDIKQ
ncbi:MAG: hypothetical protein SWJ54_18900, partial [Cyanobacteriota bacterium]|nr:hypothetical protein [Cyanobacteriota bacterium]